MKKINLAEAFLVLVVVVLLPLLSAAIPTETFAQKAEAEQGSTVWKEKPVEERERIIAERRGQCKDTLLPPCRIPTPAPTPTPKAKWRVFVLGSSSIIASYDACEKPAVIDSGPCTRFWKCGADKYEDEITTVCGSFIVESIHLPL